MLVEKNLTMKHISLYTIAITIDVDVDVEVEVEVERENKKQGGYKWRSSNSA